MHKFFMALALASYLSPALAQTGAVAPSIEAEAEPEVEPEQHDFKRGTGIAPVGKLLLDTSFFSTRRGQVREYVLGQSLVRFGISKNFDVRATIPGYLIDRDLSFLNGLEDGELEARLRFARRKNTDYALTLGSSIPTGKRGIAERRYQPQAIVSIVHTLNPKVRVTANLGIASRTDTAAGERFAQSILALGVNYKIRPRLELFAETYGFNREAGERGSQKFVAGGGIFQLNRKTALFGRVGGGISNDVDGPDRLLQLGASRLF